MKRLFKWLGIIIAILLAALIILFLFFNEGKPKGTTGPEAEALAQKMLNAVDKPGWDSTAVVQWTFAGIHHYLWDKTRHLAKIEWDDHMVLLNPNEVSGKVYVNGQEITGEEADKAVQTAWGFWCNDSFWLNAAVKCYDPGTSRSLVRLEDGSDALLVSYESGGVTPGDSYLWILDETGLPKSWKMWTKIIPVGGVETTWENYTTLYSGAKIAGLHKSKIFDLELSNIDAAPDFQSLGVEDPFSPISE